MEKASTSIRSRSRRPAADLAAALLDAAAVEFAAHGFEGASTRRIAERAGAHQPQINYHFASKEQLWRATVDHLFALLVVPDVAAAPDPASAFAAGASSARCSTRTPGGKDCPTGFYSSGNYCKQYPSQSGKEAISREQGESCPGGWYKSGQYCAKNGE